MSFSAEKKFNSDGPDGFAHYTHDRRNETRPFSTRRQGGKSVMVWGAMAYNQLLNLRLSNDIQTSKTYCEVLRDGLLEFCGRECG